MDTSIIVSGLTFINLGIRLINSLHEYIKRENENKEVLGIMKVECDTGVFDCESAVEIERALRKATTQSLAEIWLSDQEPYPCLAILTNQGEANLTYFASEEEFYGSLGDFNRDDGVLFKAGGQDTEMAAYTVVSLELAIECALEFFRSNAKPTLIEWAEL